MAGKKIGLVLALDNEKGYVQAVQNVRKETKLYETELKTLSKEAEGNANTLENLQKKQEVLTKAQDAYQKQLESTKDGLEKANKTYSDQSKRLEELEKQLDDAKKAQEQMEDAGEDGTEAYEKQTKAVQELEEAVEKQILNRQKAAGRITDWNKRVYESESALKQNEKAIQQNEKYIEEAQKASDKCATSIDKMGKEVKDAGDEFEGTSKDASTFSDVLKANLTGTAIIEGLETVVDKAKEAAEFVVDVGSSFEAAISEVEAISGATGDELSAMSEKAKELGSSTKFSASEAADAFKYMSLAGWSTTDMLSGIDGIMNLAAASGMELAAASDMVTDYLSAFGMQAEDSAYMADMLAYAQSNSNTTAEQLGEAYKNCAANLNASGQDIETTTSLLEAMANQGLKGSEAGTALSAMMRDITAKMKDGKIAIGDTNVAVMDANGNYRDLTDILSDVEKATEGMGDAEKNTALQSTFTADSIKGLNLVLADGMENVSGYEEALRNSDGAAKRMSDTMNDNLKGDLTTMNSSLEGLGIAAYNYIDGPVRGVVQGVTDIISGITDAITPQKTALEKFIDEIKTANDEVQGIINGAESTMSGAEADVSKLEEYKNILIDLNEETNKTEYQKYQMKTIVEELSGSIPELAAAYDEETSSIDLSREAISRLIEKQEAYLLQQASMTAKEDAYKALFEAQMNAAKAASAVEKAQEDYDNTLKSGTVTIEDATGVIATYSDESQKAYKILSDAKDEQEKANKSAEEAEKAYGSFDDTLKSATESMERITGVSVDATDAQEDVKESIEEVGNAASETEREFDALGREITGMSDDAKEAAKEAAQEIVDAYDGVKEGLENSIEGSISIFDKFAEQTPITINKMIENLDSQITALNEWESNMETLAGKIGEGAGKGMSQELYDTLVALGPEQTAAAVSELVRAAKDQTSDFEAVSNKYEEALALKTDAETLAKQTTAGKKYTSAVAQGISDGTIEVENASKGAAEAALEEFQKKEEEIKNSGISAVKLYEEALLNGTEGVSSAAAGLGKSAYDALVIYEEKFHDVGANMSAGIASGIRDGRIGVSNAIVGIIEAGLSAGKAAAEIKSPSRKFRREIGQQIGKGTAFGISDTASLAGDAAAKMSSNVYKRASAWMEKYKKSHKVSLEDEQYFWQQIVKHTKSGTEAYEKAVSKLASVNNSLIGSALNSKISNNFGVSRYESNDEDILSDGAKDAETYYKEIYSAAKDTLNKYKVLHDVSLEAEIEYWQKVKNNIMSGMDAWYSAQEEINSLKEDIVERDEELNNAIVSNGEKYVERQKILGNMDIKTEIAYWKQRLKEVKSGSDAYYDILEKLNDLEEEKTEQNNQRIQDRASVQDKMLSSYKTYYKVSERAEMQYWDIARKQFKQGTQERIDADAKYYEAQQAWYDKRKELDEDYLEQSKEINDELIDSVNELKDAYEDAVESRKQDILSSMNLFEAWDATGYDADTLIYNLETQVQGLALWEQQLEKLKERGISTDLYDYLLDQGPDAAANIYSLANATDEQLKKYQELFEQKNALAKSQALKDNEGLFEDTNSQISQLQEEAQKKLDELNATYKESLAEINKDIDDTLTDLANQTRDIGEDAIAGLIAGIEKKADSVDVYKSTTKVVTNVSSYLELLEESGSKIGGKTLENLLNSMVDEDKISNAAQTAVESVKYAMDKAFEEEYANLSYAGIAKLNRMLEYAPQDNTIVNVDNTGMVSAMQSVVDQIKTLTEQMKNLQVVMYPDAVVGELQEKMSQENATVSVRKRRGNL